MKIKPGKYVQRDGRIATVVAINEKAQQTHQVIGWTASGYVTGWQIDGLYYNNSQIDGRDLIREYREPREFWVSLDANGEVVNASDRSPIATGYIKVREVLPND